MKILLISGILDNRLFNPSWREWGREMKELYPNAECIEIRSFYLWWQIERLENMITRGLESLKDEKPALIIAHSFGGILAKAIIGRTTNKNIKLVTMGTPHTYNSFRLRKSRNKIKAPDCVTGVPIISFGGYLDFIVPYVFTRMAQERHRNLVTEHLGFLLLKTVRKKVQKEIVRMKINNKG